jgi:hypothetical protein
MNDELTRIGMKAIVDSFDILPQNLSSGWADVRRLWATYKN